MSEIHFLNPNDLHEHPLLRNQPAWAEDDTRFLALCDDVREHGVIEPIKINSENAVVDGRHRWRAAKRQQQDVPTMLVADAEVSGIILSSLLHRRHYTPGQRAYVLSGVIDSAFDEAQRRMVSGVKTDPRNSVSRVKSPEDWAAQIGVSVQYLRQAYELRKLMTDTEKRNLTDRDGNTEDDVTFREFFEPKLMADEDPYGLGAALTGIKTHIQLGNAAAKGRLHTGGKPASKEKQLDLFDDTIKDTIKRFAYFQSFDDDTRRRHFQLARSKAETLPPETCEGLAAYHTRLAKEFSAAAKVAQESAAA